MNTARTFCEGITSALKDGGFDLCKWRSSHPEVLPVAENKQSGPLEAKGVPTPAAAAGSDKILGMCYDFASDMFSFQPNESRMNQVVTTKRGMLQVIASLFDPMGCAAPSIHIARLLFQKAVRAVKGWDDSDRLPQSSSRRGRRASQTR